MYAFLRTVALLSLLSVGCHVAWSQSDPTASGPGANISVGGGVTAFQADYGKRWLGGYFAFVDVHPHWRYGLEGEYRTLRFHTDEDVKESMYVGGLHVYLRPQRFRPYGKFLLGVGHIDYPFGYATGNYLALVPGGGIDYQINDWLSIRPVDFEYQMWQKFDFGPMHPYGFSTGINIRLNGIHRYPGHKYPRGKYN